MQYSTFLRRVLGAEGFVFDVKQGEVVGIIGRNGPGRSTLFRNVVGDTAASSVHTGVPAQDDFHPLASSPGDAAPGVSRTKSET